MHFERNEPSRPHNRRVVRRCLIQPESPGNRATPTSPPHARRCRARRRCPRNSRSAAGEDRSPAAIRAGRSSRHKSQRTALLRNRRTRARAAADSSADRTGGWRPSAGRSSGPTSSVVDRVCVCPSPWPKCSTTSPGVDGHAMMASEQHAELQPAQERHGYTWVHR